MLGHREELRCSAEDVAVTKMLAGADNAHAVVLSFEISALHINTSKVYGSIHRETWPPLGSLHRITQRLELNGRDDPSGKECRGMKSNIASLFSLLLRNPKSGEIAHTESCPDCPTAGPNSRRGRAVNHPTVARRR